MRYTCEFDGVTVIEAPVPETVTEPPENAALPTNVPEVDAEKIPPSVYVPAAQLMLTALPLLTPVEPAVQVVRTLAYPPPDASLAPVVLAPAPVCKLMYAPSAATEFDAACFVALGIAMFYPSIYCDEMRSRLT
jgi:hypothetical protein